MKQLKLLAPIQVGCVECRQSFVPCSKDLIRSWEREFNRDAEWLHDIDWAIDRVYQDNLHYCSPECMEKSHVRQAVFELERTRHKSRGKYR
jgi:hypothetical protein